MRTIQEKIKELQRAQAKIDLYVSIENQIKSLPANEYQDLEKEVAEEFSRFVAARIKSINQQMTDSEPKPIAVSNPTHMTPPAKEPQPKLANKKDVLTFALENRNLEGKRVRLNTQHGQVLGVVVGLNFPNITVKTDTDFTVNVPLENLEVI
jgi:hypothetical protein